MKVDKYIQNSLISDEELRKILEFNKDYFIAIKNGLIGVKSVNFGKTEVGDTYMDTFDVEGVRGTRYYVGSNYKLSIKKPQQELNSSGDIAKHEIWNKTENGYVNNVTGYAVVPYEDTGLYQILNNEGMDDIGEGFDSVQESIRVADELFLDNIEDEVRSGVIDTPYAIQKIQSAGLEIPSSIELGSLFENFELKKLIRKIITEEVADDGPVMEDIDFGKPKIIEFIIPGRTHKGLVGVEFPMLSGGKVSTTDDLFVKEIKSPSNYSDLVASAGKPRLVEVSYYPDSEMPENTLQWIKEQIKLRLERNGMKVKEFV